MSLRMTMTGDAAMRANLMRVASDRGVRKQARKAVLAVGGRQIDKAAEDAPEDTGDLKGSKKVKVRISATKEDIAVHLIFGGPEAPYAPRVHETHKTKAKFLEKNLLQAAGLVLREISDEFDLNDALNGAA